MSIWSDLALSRRPLAAFLVVGFGWGSFAGLVPAVKAQIGASDALYGILMLIASLGALAAMWLVPFAFRLMGRWAIVIGALGIGFGFALAGGMTTPISFVLALLLATCGSGVCDVLANAEVSEAESASHRALMNLNHGIYSFAFAGGALAAGVLRDAGWGPSAILWGLAGVTCLLCLMMYAPNPAAPADETAGGSIDTLPSVLVWLGGGIVMAAFLAEAATEGWSALHLERSLGAGPSEGALGPALFGVMMGVGRLFGHAAAARFSDLWLMGAACLASAVGLALAGGAPGLVVAYVGFAVAGLGIAVVVPLALGLVGRSVPPGMRLVAITRASALGYAAFFLGPPIMGAVAQVTGLPVSFGLVGAVLVAVALIAVPAFARQVSATASPK